MKRGQITIILIIIVVMIAVFFTLNYIGSQRVADQGQAEITRGTLHSEQVGPIKEVVEECLNFAAVEGVKLLGEQGGYIYSYQGGSAPDFDERSYEIGGDLGLNFARFESVDVGYAIYEPVGSVGSALSSTPPKYPWSSFPELHRRDPVLHYHYEGYFGQNRLVPLNTTGVLSAQEQLKTYVEYELANCIDLDNLPQNLEIQAGRPNVTISLAEKHTEFALEYPINLTDSISRGATQLDSFIERVPVRLKGLFTFMNQLTDAEVTNISFDARAARGDGMRVEIVPDVFEKDYIIRLLDDESKLQGEPYVFQFMAHNRRPALFLVNHTRTPEHAAWVNNFTVCASWTANGNDRPATILLDGNTLSIVNPERCNEDDLNDPEDLILELEAMDPDPDNLTFSYKVGNDLRTFEAFSEEKLIDANRISRLDREGAGGVSDPLFINISVTDGDMSDSQILSFEVTARAPNV